MIWYFVRFVLSLQTKRQEQHMAEKRNSYLVSKALKTFMFASVLASLAQQLATMTDAIVVSNLIGPDAISAVNVVAPIIALFPTISILFGIGGSVLAAKAIGRRDAAEANQVFTSALTASVVSGVLLTLLLCLLTPEIVALVCPRDSRFFDMAVSYLHTMSLGTVLIIAGFTIQNFVKTDGNPRLVMMAVMSSTVLNLILDILFIKGLGMGIDGSALGSIICFIFSISICLTHFRNKNCSFRLLFAGNRMGSDVMRCITEGFPMSINTLLMGICVYGFNSIVIHSLGADGMYVWSVCLQLLMLTQLMLAGIGSSIYSIGGLLIGERDMIGLNILIRRVLFYVSISLLALILMIEIWPELFGNLFGGNNSGVSDLLHKALRIFSLMLLPFSWLAILRALYQMVGFHSVSIVISIGQLVVMVFFVWIFSTLHPYMLWWGYPASAVALIAVIVAITWVIHARRPEYAPVTLIPQVTKGQALNFSVRLTASDVASALGQIVSFLQECDISKHTAYSIRLCCDELLNNIVRYAVKKHPDRHFIDIHIRCTESVVSVLLKDDGRPFNPILKETPEGIEHLGLRLVNGTTQNMTYKYMYDQNMVYMTFFCNQ